MCAISDLAVLSFSKDGVWGHFLAVVARAGCVALRVMEGKIESTVILLLLLRVLFSIIIIAVSTIYYHYYFI